MRFARRQVMRSHRSALVSLTGLVLIGASAGCAARVSQFDDFAAAGVTYVKASDAVLEEAGTATIRADTDVLIIARPNTPEAERRPQLLKSNGALKVRMEILRDLRRHGRVLQRYFEALANIADSKAPQSAATAAESAFSQLADLSTAIKNSPLKLAIPAVTKLIVGSFKVRILENELKLRADAVAAELALQQAAFKVIGEQLATDLGVQLNRFETSQVIRPFVADAPLPGDWAASREQFLKAGAAASSADAAARAAGSLREAFAAVVANRFDQSAFNSLLEDIGEVLTIAEQIAPLTREE